MPERTAAMAKARFCPVDCRSETIRMPVEWKWRPFESWAEIARMHLLSLLYHYINAPIPKRTHHIYVYSFQPPNSPQPTVKRSLLFSQDSRTESLNSNNTFDNEIDSDHNHQYHHHLSPAANSHTSIYGIADRHSMQMVSTAPPRNDVRDALAEFVASNGREWDAEFPLIAAEFQQEILAQMLQLTALIVRAKKMLRIKKRHPNCTKIIKNHTTNPTLSLSSNYIFTLL